MKYIQANIEQGTVSLNSEEIKDMIENSNFFEEVVDISHQVYEDNILAFRVKLDGSILEEEVERDLEEEGYVMTDEDEYTSVLLEQAEYFIDSAVDDIKDRIESRYNIAHMGSSYNIYQSSSGTSNVRFVLTLSFGAIGHGQLFEITNAVVDKNYTRNTGEFQ
ncbi:hypothetical protein [Geosporobacter ferrireducens]|uniref:Uncharacterized protein n=1 Tax=Geosporobacter ferrireducens TaxID=1424294 RepID=A0A1D8GH50_9FIRM|nr:hypothetical protein [Geosporobacter ferrireducens]AOT70242.1 hypothetical protein Gferi_11940 [Geosporobacter ferrireducens]MTI55798.1 hypothetical protein [Geosporobacter ferrireducens]